MTWDNIKYLCDEHSGLVLCLFLLASALAVVTAQLVESILTLLLKFAWDLIYMTFFTFPSLFVGAVNIWAKGYPPKHCDAIGDSSNETK